jgi:predicted HAD superfamily hydrolase
LTPKQRKKIQNIEIKQEYKSVYINKEILKWIKIAKKADKKVILTSDMYLNFNQIKYIVLSKIKNYELATEIRQLLNENDIYKNDIIKMKNKFFDNKRYNSNKKILTILRQL